jgi:hypothetical protein
VRWWMYYILADSMSLRICVTKDNSVGRNPLRCDGDGGGGGGQQLSKYWSDNRRQLIDDIHQQSRSLHHNPKECE